MSVDRRFGADCLLQVFALFAAGGGERTDLVLVKPVIGSSGVDA
jgi:hypothetical protein